MKIRYQSNENKAGQAVIAIFRTRNLNSLSDSTGLFGTQPKSQSSVTLGRSLSVTRNRLCASVLLNTLDTTVTIQRGKNWLRFADENRL